MFIKKKNSIVKPFLLIFFLLGFVVLFFSYSFKQNHSPNVVLIYLDDLGYGDISRNGTVDYQTPNFEQMAREGLTFTQFYSPQAVCTASRAGLLTGCYPNRLGFSGALDHTAKVGINSSEVTIAEMLRGKGYKTAAFGKWHLGHHKKFLPLQHGFDEFFGIPYSNDMWPNHPVNKNYYPPLPLFKNDSVVQTNPDQSQFTTWFTEKTVDFITKNKNKPFFVYLAHPMPHVPLFVSNKFKGKSKQGLYGDVIMELDWSLGEIKKILKKLDLEENTILIITSDNGPWINYGNHAGSTGGLREGKGSTYEGGQKVPCLMQWKGVFSPGKVINGLSSAIDILPTIAEATSAKLPENLIDGISLLPLAKGIRHDSPREVFYYYYRKNSLEAIRYKNWKMVFSHPGRTYLGFLPGKDGLPGPVNENFNHEEGLYDLTKDPGERNNLIHEESEIVKVMVNLAEKAREDLGDELQNHPGKNRRLVGKIDN